MVLGGMKRPNRRISVDRASKEKLIIAAAAIVLLYLLISLYFNNHYFFHTEINGVDVSLKAHDKAEHIIKDYLKDYRIELIERDGETEVITGAEVGMQYNERNGISNIHRKQNNLKWITSLARSHNYYVADLYYFNNDSLNRKVNQLNCMNKKVVEPSNVNFKYYRGTYEVIKEVYGNKVIEDQLKKTVQKYMLQGKTQLDLNKTLCYENPKYTLSSAKTLQTKSLLHKYVSAKITYLFGSKNEIIDGAVINRWLSVDSDLEVVINSTAAMNYIKQLSNTYDTVGVSRDFNTSVGKKIVVSGGLYGWKIDREGEAEALINHIKRGEIIQKEPIYIQRALYRDTNDIGNTYVEINITRQHLWFYRDGKLITHGSVVTGNPNRGNATVRGTYMLIYKQIGATLTGPGYEAPVTYWMPFFGDMGIHDASWRHSFGGEIYKSRGSHGCVNAPIYLAKKIFENIDEGIPIIIYEE